jgi:translation initiation factor IF-2
MKDTNQNLIERPSIIAVMGHIDHGKSTLLDYIRKTNVTEREAGGITQHLSAYEVNHEGKDGEVHRITFLDTPGHEAFRAIRTRGARVADIGILVVSAEDGVKPQTIEALNSLREANMPFVVAINKIDKPGANIEKTKQNLAENDVYLEGYGGKVPWVAISAKTGDGVSELLDLLLLVAELEEFKANPLTAASGFVIESNLDTKKGIVATAIITDGTIKKGLFAVCGNSISPTRILENFLGKPINEATFSSPIRIIGWDSQPLVGEKFICFSDKKDAFAEIEKYSEIKEKTDVMEILPTDVVVIPVVLKADTSGSLEALLYEITKLANDRIKFKIILSNVGPVAENDVKAAGAHLGALVIGFHTKVEPTAASLALRIGIKVESFDIIYKLTEWLEETLKERTPSIEAEEVTGKAKILKFFSITKDKQILGGKVESGAISVNEAVKIMRRDVEIARGRIRELQMQKEKTSSVPEDKEFGAMIEAKIEIAPGDRIESFTIVNK